MTLEFSAWSNAWSLNSSWMSWNLFLALVPLALSFTLFCRPRSNFFIGAVLTLLGGTFWPNIPMAIKYLNRLLLELNGFYLCVLFGLILLVILIDLKRSALFNQTKAKFRSLTWWLGFFAFVGFLPNAPYVLTDIIHLYDDIRWLHSPWVLTLALVPQYFIFMLIGFGSYVLSLLNVCQYLKQQGWPKLCLTTELILHGLCAIGIYLGRFWRFNTWHIITNPDELVTRVMSDLADKRPLLVIFITYCVISILYWLLKPVAVALIQSQNKMISSGL